MKATDLRIGNLVNKKIIDDLDPRKEWHEASKIDAQDLVWLEKNPNDEEEFQPIPLTEECLLKFGFRKVKNNWYNVHINGNTFNVYIFRDLRYRIEIVSQSIGVFEYIHTLQNLHFALSGKELLIK